MKFERIYHPVWLWEENEHNMWGDVADRADALKKAIEFTGDHKRYGRFMQRVVSEWEYSCENALTDSSLNRKAWVGHAACALALAIPEDITRKAWGLLTDEQRLLANKEADRAIQAWEHDYAKSLGICEDLGEPLL